MQYLVDLRRETAKGGGFPRYQFHGFHRCEVLCICKHSTEDADRSSALIPLSVANTVCMCVCVCGVCLEYQRGTTA